MKLGVAVSRQDPWRFFEEIYKYLQQRHAVSVFESRNFRLPIFNTRINARLFEYDLRRFMDKNEVVFFEWSSDLLAAASHLPKSTRIITRLHRYEMFQWVERVNWENVDRVILVSRAMQTKFSERFPAHAHKTCVIYNWVDTERYAPVNKAFGGDLGTLCFPHPRKRVYELILALAELNRLRPGFRLHVGGTSQGHDDYHDALASLVHKLGMSEQVLFYGDVPDPQPWLSKIDIFISNSYSEGLQVAPIEAMASGRWTLSHHWDGAEELVPAENLYLTDRELLEQVCAYADAGEPEQLRRQEAMRTHACRFFDLRNIRAQVTNEIEALAGASQSASAAGMPAPEAAPNGKA